MSFLKNVSFWYKIKCNKGTDVKSWKYRQKKWFKVTFIFRFDPVLPLKNTKTFLVMNVNISTSINLVILWLCANDTKSKVMIMSHQNNWLSHELRLVEKVQIFVMSVNISSSINLVILWLCANDTESKVMSIWEEISWLSHELRLLEKVQILDVEINIFVKILRCWLLLFKWILAVDRTRKIDILVMQNQVNIFQITFCRNSFFSKKLRFKWVWLCAFKGKMN